MEPAWIGELRRIVVRRDIVEHQPVVLGDLLAVRQRDHLRGGIRRARLAGIAKDLRQNQAIQKATVSGRVLLGLISGRRDQWRNRVCVPAALVSRLLVFAREDVANQRCSIVDLHILVALARHVGTFDRAVDIDSDRITGAAGMDVRKKGAETARALLGRITPARPEHNSGVVWDRKIKVHDDK